MIVTLTPNPALDMTWTSPQILVGESHRVPTAASRAGGKGVNVARVAAQQGFDVLAIAPVGGPIGDEFAADLAASAVRSLLVPVSAPTRRTAAFVSENAGVTTILNESGSALLAEDWEAIRDAITSALTDATVLVVSGSLPPAAPADFHAHLIATAREQGIPTIIDTSGPALLAAADAGADVLKPNREELVDATGESDPLAGARALIRRGAGLVLLSLGADGMVAVSADDPDRPLGARLPQALVGNATGAGDAAVAAVACELARGERRTDRLLRSASAWSAAAVLMPLAGEISPRHAELSQQLIMFDPTSTPTPSEI